MTGRFGIGTMHAVFQVVGTVFVEKRIKYNFKKYNASLHFHFLPFNRSSTVVLSLEKWVTRKFARVLKKS